jgi:hypothetical protein
MYVKQISVFIENTKGRLADITSVLARGSIDIRALSLADTTNFGILRLIVDRPFDAEKMLKESGFTVSVTSVIAIGIEDRPGALAEALKILEEGDISVEYLYAFISKTSGKASVILRVDDGDKAVEMLVDGGITFLSDKDIIEI